MTKSISTASGAVAEAQDLLLLWQFGRFALNEASMELSVDGNAVDVEPKPLELLIYLLQRAGEVVTKEEILASLWPGRIVTDASVTNCVNKLRIALEDHEHDLIRTVSRYGYRLMANVKCQRLTRASKVTNDLGLSAGDPLPERPNWRLLRQLSSGAHGEVWLAEQDKTGTQRVVKFGRDAKSLGAIKREITLYRVLTGTLGDTGDFVRILDWNLDTVPFFIESEYSPLGNLADWCEARGGVERIPLETRLELVAQCAAAVAAAHSAGVLHKDLKPSNMIIVSGDGDAPRIRLCDFGAGAVFDSEILIQMSITRLGFTQNSTAFDATGTPLYLAPEQIAGQPSTMLSDIYALGCILYQMTVGDLKRVLAPGWEADIEDPLLREDIAIAAAGNPKRRLGDAGQLALRLRSLPARRKEFETRQKSAAAALQLRHAVEKSKTRNTMLMTLVSSLVFILAVLSWFYYKESSAGKAAAALSKDCIK